MKGSNSLRLCGAAMMEALEYWLSLRLLRSEVLVSRVSEDATAHTFTVRFVSRPVAAQEPTADIVLADTTVQTAVAYWLNNAVLSGDPVAVHSVREHQRDGVFEVQFRTAETGAA